MPTKREFWEGSRAFQLQTALTGQVFELKPLRTSYLTGGFLFINNSMAFSSSGSTTTSGSQSAGSVVPAAPSEGHSSSESASSPPGPTITRLHIYTYILRPLFFFATAFYSINRNKVILFIQLSILTKWCWFVKTRCSFSRKLS